MGLIIFGVYTFLAGYNAGNMTSLQIQHYGIYPFVGKENFKSYMTANNKAAVIPAIIPGMLMLILSIILMFILPVFMTSFEGIALLVLNIIAFISTFKWHESFNQIWQTRGMSYGGRKPSYIFRFIVINSHRHRHTTFFLNNVSGAGR
ncbi:MAG: hypothetical protein ABIR81_09540 [Ginsengibacter sp.]